MTVKKITHETQNNRVRYINPPINHELINPTTFFPLLLIAAPKTTEVCSLYPLRTSSGMAALNGWQYLPETAASRTWADSCERDLPFSWAKHLSERDLTALPECAIQFLPIAFCVHEPHRRAPAS